MPFACTSEFGESAGMQRNMVYFSLFPGLPAKLADSRSQRGRPSAYRTSRLPAIQRNIQARAAAKLATIFTNCNEHIVDIYKPSWFANVHHVNKLPATSNTAAAHLLTCTT